MPPNQARGVGQLLSQLGRAAARGQDAAGFPGNDWLADLAAFGRRPRDVPGRVVELPCHPGFREETLVGRDHLVGRRMREYELLRRPDFLDACRRAGFALASPAGGAYAA